jgi:hypothetical protein
MLDDFLKFDKMITPVIIKVIFWIGLVASVIIALGMIISGLGSRLGGGIEVLTGLVTLVLGPLMVRIYCELLIVIFKINDSLSEIKENIVTTQLFDK